jgi:protein-ribulosamine 3-kinase
MLVPTEISHYLSNQHSLTITHAHAIGGGCINHCVKIQSAQDVYFLKWNVKARFPNMFEHEQQSLEILKEKSEFTVPAVYQIGHTENYSFLLMEYIDSTSRNSNFWDDFGDKLARMHQNTAAKHGFFNDNYIGSLVQYNDWETDGIDFYIKKRMFPQIHLAQQSNLLPKKEATLFEYLLDCLPQLIPNEQPSLLHGDLWSGNYLVSSKGEACLIDPAVYYGLREAELAFMQLFGGFENRLFEAYQASFPLQPGFSHRKDLYNLYPLLVHLNLFGRSYLSSISSILKKYS